MQRDATAVIETPPTTTTSVPAFVRVEVHFDVAAVDEVWSELERDAPCSVYQTRAWLKPWVETLAGKSGIRPAFALVRGANDRAVALLLLGIVQRGPLRLATWLGGRDANFNLALMRPDIVWSGTEVSRLLRETAKAFGKSRPDLFHLANQPFEWGGRANPFARLPHQIAPSAAFGATIPTDAAAFLATRLSKDTQKKLRKKEAKLASFGPLRHLVVSDATERQRVLDSFIAQKVARFETKKIVSDFATPQMRAFIESASRPDGTGIELHALLAGERIVATYGGAAHNGQWSGMFNAFDADEEIARSSPGDLLLTRVIAKICADGATRFDLGIGEARYKAMFCDTRIDLFDVIIPVSAMGTLAAGIVATRQTAKRAIKARPRLYEIAKKVRAFRR